jgi:hypothetical protein
MSEQTKQRICSIISNAVILAALAFPAVAMMWMGVRFW